MALSCSYRPYNKKGEELKEFQTYKKELGYRTAAKVFTKVLSPTFQKDFKRKLEFDAQGVPTYNSAVKVPYIKNLIGTTKLIEADQKKFPYVENTRENYQRLLQSANAYNTNSDNNDDLVAVVTPSDDRNNIRVEIRERNDANVNEYRNQYSTFMLNDKLEEILGDLGITVDLLERNELTDGYVDFSKASSIADGFAGLINIANGMEGEISLSEEFSHVIIGLLRDTPFVQRSLNTLANNEALLEEILGDDYITNRDYYLNNPNYDALGNKVPLNETLAEEALGKILQDKLKTNSTTVNSEDTSRPLHNLIQRLISYIKKLFKGMNSDDIIKAKNEVDTTMSELAKQVLTGSVKLSNEELVKNKRNARFNSLRNANDKIIQALRNANEVERKRTKISPKDEVKEIKKRVTKLESLINDRNKLEGLCTYANWALSDLQNAMNKLDISGTLESNDFTALRHIKAVLDSYSGFIDVFHEALDGMAEEDTIVTVNDEEFNLRELWRDIDDIYKTCVNQFKNQALTAFSDFMAPIYNKAPLRNPDGSIKPLEEVLLGEEFDISEFDRWLVSMGNSSSMVLQLFDKSVKNTKDTIRLNTIKYIRDIWALRDKAEKIGITDFEWMFEKTRDGHKTGNYLSEYNIGQYEADEKAMLASLTEKYGKQPVGEAFKKAFAERKAWYAEHADFDVFGTAHPNASYKNPEFSKLSQSQREVLEDYLRYKAALERKLPKDRRNRERAIQRRRKGTQRIADMFTNPSQAFESIKNDVSSAFFSAEDDDIMYGETTKGLTDFTGHEYLTLPILYTGRLKNPDTLSTDVFSDLMAYAYMANTYEEMNKICDPLEIGVSVVADKEFIKGADSKVKEEVLNTMGRSTRKPVRMDSNTSFAKKLHDFLECQMYGKYMKEDDILGKDGQKTLSFLQKMTSTAYMGCNLLAGIANIATATGMQNIEAAAGEFFGAKELAKADIEYGKMIPEFVAEITDRKKQSELALFDELFNVRQNFKDKIHNTQMKSIFHRFFGNNWLFIQNGLGDHWIYNRTALAMAKKRMVKVDGKIMSVWDAREIITDENGYKTMRIKPGAIELEEDPKHKGQYIEKGIFDAGAFSREIAHINHTLVGIYNDDDMNAANRVVIGRLAQQMRKWIIPQMMRRFQSKRTILDIGKEEEGYYRTAGRLVKDIWKSGFKITAEWDKLDNTEKANVRRALMEMIQTYSLWLLVSLLGSGVKDPDRSWGAQFAEYMMHREIHELGFLTPGPMMFTEGYKTVTSPFVAASAANKLAQAMMTTMWPGNWFPDDDELIQSGRYEGHSHIYKRWMELPLPPMTQFRQIDKFIDDLDTGTKYYSRDYK